MKHMTAMFLTILLVVPAAFAQVDDHAKAKKGAAIGGIAGGIVGAVIGNNRNGHSAGRGAVVGTLAGAGAGETSCGLGAARARPAGYKS